MIAPIDNTIIVAGTARSGLSVTMQMLDAGGVRCVGEWPAFEPHTIGNIPWNDVSGMAVKLIDAQLQWPPAAQYKVIRLQRNTKHQAESTAKFVRMVCGVLPPHPKRLMPGLKRDNAMIDEWARVQFKCLFLDFALIVMDAHVAAKLIVAFLEQPLDVDAMAAAVVPRTPACYPGLMEAELLARGKQ